MTQDRGQKRNDMITREKKDESNDTEWNRGHLHQSRHVVTKRRGPIQSNDEPLFGAPGVVRISKK